MMRSCALLACVAMILPVSCAPTTQTSFEIVAHRGASWTTPENTLASFNRAWELGADAVEGDFHLTIDGHIVALHDETTGRTAGTDLEVNAATLAELRELEVGAWMHERWTGERIPTLPEVMATVPDGRRIFIEIKCDPRIVPALARVVEASDVDRDQMVVIAFDAEVIAEVKVRIPWMKAYWVSDFEEGPDGGWEPSLAELIETARRIGADGVDINANPEIVNEAFVRGLRRAGLAVHVWTVNEAELGRRMAALGVDSITTGRPRWLREQIESAE